MIYIVLYGSIQDCPLTLAGTHEVVHDVVVVRHAAEDAFYHAFLALRRYLLGVGGGEAAHHPAKTAVIATVIATSMILVLGIDVGIEFDSLPIYRNRFRYDTDISESISVRYRYIGIDFITITIYRNRFSSI